MANVTRSIADTAGFIPQVWANRALDVLRSNIVLARTVTKDTDYEPAFVGKTLNVPYPGTFTAADKAADTAATAQTPSSGTSVAVTLNKHKYVDFIVEDVARAQSSNELLDRYVAPAAQALAEALEDDLFALYTNYATLGTSGTSLTAATVLNARKALNDAQAPVNGRSIVMSTKDEVALLGDSTLSNYFAFGQNAAVAEGSIGRLYGFDLFVSQRVPVVAGSPNSTKNLAIVPDAMMLATRPFMPAPAGSGVQTSNLVDPASGLSIRVQYQYSMADRGTRVGFDILYGVAALRPAVGRQLLS